MRKSVLFITPGEGTENRVAARPCGPLAQSMVKRPGTRRKRQRRVAADITVRAPVNSIVI